MTAEAKHRLRRGVTTPPDAAEIRAWEDIIAGGRHMSPRQLEFVRALAEAEAQCAMARRHWLDACRDLKNGRASEECEAKISRILQSIGEITRNVDYVDNEIERETVRLLASIERAAVRDRDSGGRRIALAGRYLTTASRRRDALLSEWSQHLGESGAQK